MLYGDFDVGHEKLSAFIGYSKNNDSKPTTIKRKVKHRLVCFII